MFGTLPRARHAGTRLSHGRDVVIKKKRVNGEPLTAVTAPPPFTPPAARIIALAATGWRPSVAPGERNPAGEVVGPGRLEASANRPFPTRRRPARTTPRARLEP